MTAHHGSRVRVTRRPVRLVPSRDGPVEGDDRVLERAHGSTVKVTRRPVRPVSRNRRVRVSSSTTQDGSRVRVTRRPVP